ncbi:Uncharacterised protein [Serratia proteamaculans]|nr:Uncharacterised protein [Serratia proteamaculans]
MQCTGVTQDREHQIGNVGRIFQIQMLETTGAVDLSVDEQDIAQHGKQVGLQRTDDSTIDKGVFRWIHQFKFDSALTAQDVNIKGFIARQQLFAVVGLAAGVQDSQRTVAEQTV